MKQKKTLQRSLAALSFFLIPVEVFGQNADASLLLARTLADCSPQLIAQESKVDGARAAAEGVRSERMPSFSVSAGAFQNNGKSAESTSSITGRVPVVTFGRQSANEQLSAARVELAESDYFQSVAEHVRNLVELWIERDAIEAQISMYQDIITEKKKVVEVVERRSTQGLSSEAELRDAQSEYVSDVTALENLRLKLITIESDIVVFGCDDMSLGFASVVAPQETDPKDLGMSLNPDLMVPRAELALTKAQVFFQARADVPGLDLEARASIDGQGDTNSRVGLTVNYEYSNLGRAKKFDLVEAEMRVREQENTLKFLIIDGEQENFANYQSSQLLIDKIIPSTQQELLSYEKSLESSYRRYEAGKLTVRDVLSDINKILQSKTGLAEAEQQLQRNYNNLAYALGRYNINR